MTAIRTLPPSRVAPLGTTAAARTLPTTPAAREAAYAEAVFAAVLTLRDQLRHPDAEIARDAAVAIIDLEKTRLRHGAPVAGTYAPSEVLEPLGELEPLGRRSGGPLSARAGHPSADPWEVFVDQVWDEMQEDADAAGQGEVISWPQAEERARVVHAERREQQQTVQAVPTAPTPSVRPRL